MALNGWMFCDCDCDQCSINSKPKGMLVVDGLNDFFYSKTFSISLQFKHIVVLFMMP